MFILMIFLITSLIKISHLAPIESIKTKKLMAIDLSKLGNSHDSSFFSSNFIKPSQQSSTLKIDLSALRKPSEDLNNYKDMNKFETDNWLNDNTQSISDYNGFDSLENQIPDYDYQPIRIIPHRIYFNSWKPEIPGNDALTDFLHEEYRNGRLVYNGKRDSSSQELEDNSIPVLNYYDTKPCSYQIPRQYGINCEQFLQLINRPFNYSKKKRSIKRNMFLSKGWGPSGSLINISPKIGVKPTKDSKFKTFRKNLKIDTNNDKLLSKSHDIRKNNDLKWSVPHLFGSF